MIPSAKPTHRLHAIAALLLFLGVPVASAGVWSHYSFDTGYTDVSGNGQDGTLTDVGTQGNSGITSAAGAFVFGDGAMDFSDEADYVAIPSKTFSSGIPYTIAFWAQRNTSANVWNMVIGNQTTNFFIALNNADFLRWRSSSNAANRQEDFVTPTDTLWHHYAIAASGTDVSFYLDGAFVSTATDKLTGIILDGIGSAYPAGNGFDFRGRIDELWVFDETLDATRIAALYTTNSPIIPLATELLHHRYDGDFNDSSPETNDGFATGAAAITTAYTDVATGGGALLLDGADGSYVDLTTPITLSGLDPWTTTFWARRAESGGQKGMIMGTRGNTRDFIWLNDNFTGLRFRSSSNVTHDFTVPQDTDLHHYALVADGAGTLTLYRDGSFLESTSGDTSFAIDSIGNAYSTLSYAMDGSIDEVHVFGSAKNDAEILAIYDAEKPGPPPAVTNLRVFLLGGQSNADGRALTSDLPLDLQQPQADIDFYYKVEGGSPALTTLRPGLSETSQFGPEITLGRRLADLFGDASSTRTSIVKYANGGTNLQNDWAAGGDNTTGGDGADYVVFQQTVTAGLAALAAAYPGAIIEIQGMAWLQGESDVVNGFHASYETNLSNFIADIRATYGANLPFIIIRLSSGQTSLNATNLGVVRGAQDAVAAADPRTLLVDSDGFGMKTDNLHFDAAGQQQIGGASGEKLVYLRWMLDTFPSAAIDAGQADMDADYDNDRQSNGDEYLFGTLPDDPLSFFQITLTRTAPDGVGISYPGAADRAYAVETWLSGTTWTELLPAENGSGAMDNRNFNSSETRNFYRVRAQLP